MTSVTTRAGKGSPLTNTEIDDNFSNLNSGKVETASKDAVNGFPGLTASFGLKLKNAAGTFVNFLVNATTAARTWTFPDKDGTVAMTSDIPAGAAPSLTLGTSNSAGVAASYVRTDATILAFDATVPTTLSYGGAAAAGSATVAARRDHTHAMPASTKDTTSVTGMLKGNGTAVSAATVRTDYAEPTTALATGLLKNTTTTGAHSIAVVRTDYAEPTTGLATGLLKNTTGTGAHSIATPGTDYPGLATVNNFTKAQNATVSALSVSANAIAVDLSLSNNFTVTLQATTAQTLSNPTNMVVGQTGSIIITQNATPSTLSYGSYWKSIDDVAMASPPAVSTTASVINVLNYLVVSSTAIWFKLNKGGQA